MDEDEIGKLTSQTLHGARTPVRSPVVDNPEHPAGMAVRRLGHDLRDQPVKGRDAGSPLAAAKEACLRYVEGGQVGHAPMRQSVDLLGS